MHIFHRRKGQMDDLHCFFYTEAIHNFRPLLKDDHCKMIIINSLRFLVTNQRIALYGYVIMPNHIHFIWKNLTCQYKESPAANFNKFTAHAFKKYLAAHHPEELAVYCVTKNDRSYQFWENEPLAIPLSSVRILQQKLDYIHNNPVREKWQLASCPEDYRWSSAQFYRYGKDEFGILQYWWA